MASTLFFFALLQAANCLPATELSARPAGAHASALRPRDLPTGSKVAIGICIPAVFLVTALGFFILVTYPKQLKKWKREKEEEQIRLDKIARGSASHELPPYSERQGSGGEVPPPAQRPTAEPAPLTAAQTRHAALFS